MHLQRANEANHRERSRREALPQQQGAFVEGQAANGRSNEQELSCLAERAFGKTQAELHGRSGGWAKNGGRSERLGGANGGELETYHDGQLCKLRTRARGM